MLLFFTYIIHIFPNVYVNMSKLSNCKIRKVRMSQNMIIFKSTDLLIQIIQEIE